MKKLIISMVATASIALVAKADVKNSTSFENYGEAANLDVTLKDDGESSAGGADRYWFGGGEAANLVLKSFGENGVLDANRPLFWKDKTPNAKYLDIDTDQSSPLVRTVIPVGSTTEGEGDEAVSVPKAVATDIGSGLYFDSMVQFTAIPADDDNGPTVTPGDKLIVWLKETEVVGEDETTVTSYNLYVTAATWDDVGTATNKEYYNINSQIVVNKDEWHRLTISAVLNTNGHPEFQVFVDGKLFKGDDGTTKFLSLSGVEDENLTKLSSVSFQGKGAIDDLVWTTEDPFYVAPPTKTYNVLVDVGPSFVTTAQYRFGDEEARVSFGLFENDSDSVADYVLTAPEDATSVTFFFPEIEDENALEGGTYVDGVWSKTITLPVVNTIALKIVKKPDEPEVAKPFTVNGVAYETLAGAIANANGETITLTEAATLTEKVTISGETVIDLNGRTLTENVDPGEGDDYGAFYVGTIGKLTITDSSDGAKGKIASNGDVVIGNYGTVIVDAGTIESANKDNTVDVSIYNFYYSATVYGKATIKGNVTSVWNCGVLTVEATAAVDYLDNSGAATIADGATVNAVVLMDGSDAPEVTGAGTLTASVSLKEKVSSGVDGYNVAYTGGVYKLEEDVVAVKPGETAEVDTEEAAEAVEIAVDVPTGATEEYKTYFKKSVTKNEETGKYVVTVVLDEAKVTPKIEAKTDDEGNVVKPAISFGPDGNVTINISNERPGLFYGVKYATTVGGVKGAKAIKGLTVTPAEGATAGFFSVEVDFTDKNFEIPAAAQQN